MIYHLDTTFILSTHTNMSHLYVYNAVHMLCSIYVIWQDTYEEVVEYKIHNAHHTVITKAFYYIV